MYVFMTKVVIMTAFLCIILLDLFALCYWGTKLVRWIKKKVHKEETE